MYKKDHCADSIYSKRLKGKSVNITLRKDKKTMSEEAAYGYISKLQFNTGEEIEINRNDIVVFVGPNNAGKSQSLVDIYKLSHTKNPTIVVSDIMIIKEGSLAKLLKTTSLGNIDGSRIYYQRLGTGVNYWPETTESKFAKQEVYGEYRDWFVSKIETAARLTICQPAQSIKRNEVQ